MTSRKDLSVSERIAALQRGSSPQPQGGRPTSPPGTPPKPPITHSLKDKIAHFDALGSAPKPIGSFGLGAPVGRETTSRELYGNRIPGVPYKPARSVSGSRAFSQLSNSSDSSLDRDALIRDSAHSRTSSYQSPEVFEADAAAISPLDNDQSLRKTDSPVPEVRRVDSLTEHWVDAQQSKPGLSVDTTADASAVLAPPSPLPETDEAVPPPAGPITPLTRTLLSHLSAFSHTPSRLGNETPVSIMVETGSLADGEQPKLVPEDPGSIPSSPVATGMQLLGLSDDHIAGDTTPTFEGNELEGTTSAEPSTSPSAVLAPVPHAAEEGPKTPLARSIDVGGSIDSVALGQSITSTGGDASHGDMLTTGNILQLNAESSQLTPGVPPSGPSSVVVEADSVAHSLQPSPTPERHPGARTPEPPSAVTPKQGLSELPAVPSGTLPLSAASLRLLGVESGKGGRNGTETPMSVVVETGSTDERLRDLEEVEPPTSTPAPASPASSYFEEPTPDVTGTDVSDVSRASTSSVDIANSEPDNHAAKQGASVPPKNLPAIATNIKGLQVIDPASVDQGDAFGMKTPTAMAPSIGIIPTSPPARAPNFIHKSRSRPDLSSSAVSDSNLACSAQSEVLGIPNSGLQRRATIGSNPKQAARRRVSRVPQMQLLPSGQWGVVDDDSDDDNTSGWAKVTVTRSRWS